MRKKWVKILGIVCLCICISTGCSNNNTSKISGALSVDDILEQQVAATEIESTEETDIMFSEEQNSNIAVIDQEEEGDSLEEENDTSNDGDIDYDLTIMGSDMVYATVNQMMVSPEDYIGKIIKISGLYDASYYEPTKQYYHNVIIKDATVCCAQGIEFIWEDGSHIYPDDYPSVQTEVEVIGTFETYTEEGDSNLYCHLVNARMTVTNN